MAASITPTLQPLASSASSAPASGLVLQSGQVITAQVVQVLGNDQVQIAIGNQTIEAATQVPLQVGQTLQLQVSQTSGGIGLAIVNQASTATGQASGGVGAASNPVITLSPSLAASLAANLTTSALTPASPLSLAETLAVSAAAQSAASQQTSLAPLFADLTVASTLPNLPPQVGQAVVQVLAQQTNLDQSLTGAAVKQAFQSSGLFLETSLASGSASPSNGVPDLKAALIVLRQTLTTALSDAGGTVPAGGSQAGVSQPAVTSDTATPLTTSAASTTSGAAISDPAAPVTAGSVAAPSAAVASNALQLDTATLAAALVRASELAGQAEGVLPAAITTELAPAEVLTGAPSIVPQAATTVTATNVIQNAVAPTTLADILELAAGSSNLAATGAPADAARAAATGVALNLLQEVLQASPLALTNLSQFVAENASALALLPAAVGVRTADDAEFARSNLPPPPLSGALPAAQPVASATLSAHMPLNTVLQHLLDDTDGALARQTLLQIASIAGHATDASISRTDASMPRWNFEIPFATPKGTAMAQFEISRDGGGREALAAKATWRARITLNVEPAGPVHALISLNGDRTSVKMWAERPATASQLRAGVSQLTQALSRAELKPGDIVVRDGVPTPAVPAPAGHFLDRAS